jgi:hypothetical protein
MSNTPETNTGIKRLHDLNLQALSDDVAKVLSKHVGGEFEVTLTKLEHTDPGFVKDKVILQFRVEDKSFMDRFTMGMDE